MNRFLLKLSWRFSPSRVISRMDSSFSNDSRSTKKSQNSRRSRDENSKSYRDTESLPSENYDHKGRSRRRHEDEISSDFRSTSRSESGKDFLSTDDGKLFVKFFSIELFIGSILKDFFWIINEKHFLIFRTVWSHFWILEKKYFDPPKIGNDLGGVSSWCFTTLLVIGFHGSWVMAR